MLTLPAEIAAACAPLFEALPLDQAMGQLRGSHPQSQHFALLETVLRAPALADRPELVAGLWLYVDDLDRSHTICQSIEDATGSYWHGIMHRREGDFPNSHHWLRRAASHPLRSARPDLDPDVFVDQVAATGGNDDSALVARQREEWKALFEWCAAHGSGH